MQAQKILGIEIENIQKKEILENVRKYLRSPTGFFHIVSLNPENLVVAQEDQTFKQVLLSAQIKLIDGVGVVVASRILGIAIGQRLTGVDVMRELISMAGNNSLRVMLIGGQTDLALSLAQCYQTKFPSAKFVGLEGIKNIQTPSQSEEDKIFSIVTTYKPHILFASFGSPAQELWLWQNREKLKGIVCMGVGGAYDFLAGRVKRAPSIVRTIGLEWLFRLLVQPWRLQRQLRLVKFMWLVLKQKLASSSKFKIKS